MLKVPINMKRLSSIVFLNELSNNSAEIRKILVGRLCKVKNNECSFFLIVFYRVYKPLN